MEPLTVPMTPLGVIGTQQKLTVAAGGRQPAPWKPWKSKIQAVRSPWPADPSGGHSAECETVRTAPDSLPSRGRVRPAALYIYIYIYIYVYIYD